MIPPARDTKVTRQPKSVTRFDWCKGYYEYPGLIIEVGETYALTPSCVNECPAAFLFALANGDVVVGSRACMKDNEDIGGMGAWPTWKHSINAGKTRFAGAKGSWENMPPWPSYAACQLPDGEIVSLGRSHLRETDRPGTYTLRVYRSTDDGHTHQGETATMVDLPKLHPDRTWVDHSVAILQDGTLLAALQGCFENDVKTRTFVMRSRDRGGTWQYLSTVAFDLDPGTDRRMDGFCEPYLLVLSSGEILCFMRSGGTCNATFTPLYLSRSIDDGQNWSHADEIADRGVWPNACRMANGILALAYGRPGDWLAFSIDEGHHWIGHFNFYHGPQSLDAANYNWVEEVAPDILLVAYSRTDFEDIRQSEILGTYLRVRRES